LFIPALTEITSSKPTLREGTAASPARLPCSFSEQLLMLTRYLPRHLQNLNEIVPMMRGAGSTIKIILGQGELLCYRGTGILKSNANSCLRVLEKLKLYS